MKIEKTEIQGCYVIQPEVFHDERGYFLESFNHQLFFNTIGRFVDFIQDNESRSSYGVIRGLHTQVGNYAQAKLVRVVQGKVKDIVIDIRPASPTFGHIVTQVLDAENKKQLFIPRGCLHGFSVLEDDTIFSYKCDAYFNKDSEIGVNPLDLDLRLPWGIEKGKEIVSPKDENAFSWSEFTNNVLLHKRRECLIRTIHPNYFPENLEEVHEPEFFIQESEGPFISSAQGM